MLPVALIACLVAAGIVSGCRSIEEPEKSQPHDPPKKNPPTSPPSFDCKGSRASLNFEKNQKLDFCHIDSNGDGLIQLGPEKIIVSNGLRVFSTQEKDFNDFSKKLGLPNLEGLNLSKWQEVHQWVHHLQNSQWTSETAGQLSLVIQFSKENSVDLIEAKSLADKIKSIVSLKQLSSKEKVYSLLIASLLLKIKQDKKNSFYLKHRKMVDTIIKEIQDGNLNLGILPYSGLPFYSNKDNAINLPPGYSDLTSPWVFSILLHELVHFYQDTQKVPLKVVPSEREAYLLEAEFLYQELKLNSETDLEGKLEEIIQKYEDKNKTAIKPSLLAIHYQSKNNKKGLQRSSQELIRAIHFSHAVGSILNYANKTGHPSLAKRLIDQKYSQDIQKAILETRKTKISELRNLEKDLKSGKKITDLQYNKIMDTWGYLYMFEQFKLFDKNIKERPNLGGFKDLTQKQQEEISTLDQKLREEIWEDFAIFGSYEGRLLPIDGTN